MELGKGLPGRRFGLFGVDAHVFVGHREPRLLRTGGQDLHYELSIFVGAVEPAHFPCEFEPTGFDGLVVPFDRASLAESQVESTAGLEIVGDL